MAKLDLTRPCTQAEFGQLVGISQPAVSEMLAKGVLGQGQTVGTWLLAYTRHLREQAAGRGADGELAANRAAESATRNQLLQIKLRKARGEYAEVALIEAVLAAVGASIASKLEALVPRIKMQCPELTPEHLKGIEAVITDVRNKAAAAGLAVLDIDPTEHGGELDVKVPAGE